MRVRLFRKGLGTFDLLVEHPRQHSLPRVHKAGLTKAELGPIVQLEAEKEASVRSQVREIRPIVPGL